VIGAWPGPGSTGPFPVADHGGLEAAHGRAQRCGHSVDASSASQSSSLFGVVGRQRQAAVKEESFQPRASGPIDRPGRLARVNRVCG
jgi:hypothetical protein